MNYFMDLYNAGAVKRWHTVNTLKEQDLAAHSWGVAMIVSYLGGSPRAVQAALVHDLHESEFGDFPFQTKRDFREVLEVERTVQAQFANIHDIENEEDLNASERALVKWADLFESWLWARREMKMGNQGMLDVVIRAGDAIVKNFPNDRARSLYDECERAS